VRTPSRPPQTTAIEVGQGDPFGVFAFEPCMTGATGTGCGVAGATATSAWAANTSALVRFPRIVGENPMTGAPYSCKVGGRVVRDRIATCTGRDTFYRIPFGMGESQGSPRS
jgi:hypothetical protein